jgi:hypothetical protein
MKKTILFLGSALLASAPAFAQTSMTHSRPSGVPAVEIPRVTEPPRLAWFVERAGGPGASAGAPVTDFRQREPGDGIAVSQATTVYLSYDDATLYVVFVCRDDPAKVRANVARREAIGGDDQVIVYLDTFRDRQHAYFFAANPHGVQQDGIVTEGQDWDLSFDAVWSSEGRITDSGYVVRLAIPFRSLRFANDTAQTWGIALGRTIQRANEEAYWPHLTKRVKGFVPQFGALQGLAHISPGRNLQLNPYSMVARARVFDADVPAHLTERDQRVGLDAKLVLHDAFTLDATVNPDFSQVETDDPQVTVNRRFEVFFPEKRPFFLENASYYQTPVNLFFSRRIVDPGAGLRLTGKAGRWAVAALAINDRAASPDSATGPDAWIGAVRVQRQLGKESTVGMLVTDREFRTSAKADRMFSADGRWRAGDHWSVAAQVMRSETDRLDGTRGSGWGVLGDVSYDSRSFDYSGIYRDFAPTFDAPLGFVSRIGYRRTEHAFQYTFRPKNRPVVKWGPALKVNVYWDHQTGRLLDREITGEFKAEFRANTNVEMVRVEAFELFDGVAFRPYTTAAKFSTSWLKWLGPEASYLWGTAVNHDPAAGLLPTLERASEAEIGLTIRPTARLRFEQAVTHGELRTAGGSRLVRERQLRSKLDYQFSPRLSLRAIVDWGVADADTTRVEADARERGWGADVLFTYLVHPGTAVYVGYTDSFENLVVLPGGLVRKSGDRTISVARQLFVKVSYLWRF